MSRFILPLADTTATLESVGGKGLSLAKMIQAGFPVPCGFHITTEAYRSFIQANGLQTKILAALSDLDPTVASSLETASTTIRGFFAGSKIPIDLADAIITAYAALAPERPSPIPVAVRSSATAEDLPEASFAGQQETYLNVQGIDCMLDRVRQCWASLWTARAIAYRFKNNIDHNTVALAVVVQEMVPAEAAGILFTANPINGRRDEMVINAAWGLGEAIVGGLVSPDTILANKATGQVKKYDVADKTAITVMTASGTQEEALEAARRRAKVLNRAQVIQLVKIGRSIESFYGKPQDIEWCLTSGRLKGAEGKFFIVQSRPITALPPEWKQPTPKVMYARGSFAEFVPDAVSPLFATLGIPIARERTVQMMNRIIEKNIPDSYHFDVINGYVYIGVPMRWEVLWPMVKASITMSKILKTSNERWSAAKERLGAVALKWQETDLSAVPAGQLFEGIREIFCATAEAYNVAQSGTIPNASSSEISFSKFYDVLIKRKGDPKAATLLFGLENQALRSEKALFDIAAWLQTQPDLTETISRTTSEEIVAILHSSREDPAWDEFRSRFDAYLKEFGHVIYDLDFARPLPLEEPAPLMDAIKMYLAGTAGNPYQRQRDAAARREQITAEITKRLDPLRRKWFLKLLQWALDTAPQREDSIADLGLAYPQIRRLLSELGQRLARQNVIGWAQDIYWLQADELESLTMQLDKAEALDCYIASVNERRTEWLNNRRLTPPVIIPKDSWLRFFLPREDQRGNLLKGFAASTGKVTAKACVLYGPEDFGKMKQGHVLVAVTTTPAWTPLFTMASAIVTDIGGPLSHSSIVAREYGIPAVLATGNGTRRITDGQTITVDGDRGTVEILNESTE